MIQIVRHSMPALCSAVLLSVLLIGGTARADYGSCESPLFALNTIWNNTGSAESPLFTLNTVWNNTGSAESPLFTLNTIWINTGFGESPLFALNTVWNNTGFGESPLFALNTIWANTGSGESSLFALNTIWTNAGERASELFALNTFWTNAGLGLSPLFLLNTYWSNIGFAVSDLFELNTFSLPASPQHLVIRWTPEGATLRWNRVVETGLHYRVYSDEAADGAFITLLATTPDTIFVDESSLEDPLATRFYLIRSLRQPAASITQKETPARSSN
ncbi:hypothetical protein KKC97_11750 [bacterium]|nr:hypothetical protein [bacterium]MBU1638330.1 hypothetical protein [bacterium]